MRRKLADQHLPQKARVSTALCIGPLRCAAAFRDRYPKREPAFLITGDTIHTQAQHRYSVEPTVPNQFRVGCSLENGEDTRR